MHISEVSCIGSGILGPEGVMVLNSGTIITADARGRCARIHRDGKTTFFGSVGGVPNGICIDKNGNCIIANIGNGQVQCLNLAGQHLVILTGVDGRDLTSPNFPFMDSKERLWVSNSTDRRIREAIENPAPDGYIVLVEKGVGRIVAEEIYFPNGLAIDRDEEYLYVAETTAKDIVRFRIGQDGSLGNREVYGPESLAPLGIPDGIAFDEAGNLWVTFPRTNAIGYISPQGDLVTFVKDPEGKVLKRPSNICFGWEDRRTAFIGSLDGRTVPFFKVPFPGLKLIHQ